MCCSDVHSVFNNGEGREHLKIGSLRIENVGLLFWTDGTTWRPRAHVRVTGMGRHLPRPGRRAPGLVSPAGRQSIGHHLPSCLFLCFCRPRPASLVSSAWTGGSGALEFNTRVTVLDRELGARTTEEPHMVGRVWHEDRGEVWRGFRCFWKALAVLRRAGRELRWSGAPGHLEARAVREEKLCLQEPVGSSARPGSYGCFPLSGACLNCCERKVLGGACSRTRGRAGRKAVLVGGSGGLAAPARA